MHIASTSISSGTCVCVWVCVVCNGTITTTNVVLDKCVCLYGTYNAYKYNGLAHQVLRFIAVSGYITCRILDPWI